MTLLFQHSNQVRKHPWSTLWYGPPIISSSNQYLFDAGSNTWHCSVATSPMSGANGVWSLVSGDAAFGSSGYANYVSSVNGGTVQVVLTNACGASTAQYFNIPPANGMLVAYPNPAKNMLTIQFPEFTDHEAAPELINLISETQGLVQTIKTADYSNTENFRSHGKIEIPVDAFPRGTYYIQAIFRTGSSGPVKYRVVLE